MSKPIRFNRFNFGDRHRRKLTRGELYTFYSWGRTKVVKFIQPTRKGFNFLDMETSKCILSQHLYAIGFGGKELPTKETTFSFWVPNWMFQLKKVDVEEKRA